MKRVKTDYNNRKMLLITYDSSKLENKDKVRFFYALKGRNGNPGVLDKYSADFLSKKVLMVPRRHGEDIKMFFESWKMPIVSREILLESSEEVSQDA